MAKYECRVKGDFDKLIRVLESGILEGSVSATLEEKSDFVSGDARCSVRVFERYSHAGGNRVSMTVVLFRNGESDVEMSTVTTGGSQAVFFKVNTWGEEAFLDKMKEILMAYRTEESDVFKV